MTQGTLFPTDVLPSRPVAVPAGLRLVPPERFLQWYRRTFGVDLRHSLVNTRMARATVARERRLLLALTEGVRPEQTRFVLRVGTFGCVLPWLREE